MGEAERQTRMGGMTYCVIYYLTTKFSSLGSYNMGHGGVSVLIHQRLMSILDTLGQVTWYKQTLIIPTMKVEQAGTLA